MKKLWIGLGVGALVGGAAVLLFAPRSDASTRRRLKRSLEDLGDNFSDAAEYLRDQAERMTKEAQRLLDSGEDAIADSYGTVEKYAINAVAQASQKASRIM